jgi:hypothetical protein
MADLRVIDFEKEKSFECKGRKFYLKEVPSFDRYREMQKICLEFGFSGSFQDVFKNIKTAWDFLNGLKLAEAAVVLHNIMYGVVALEEKYDACFRLCAIFIDEEGEDSTVYDEVKMREKIECWGKELSPLPFFQLASNLVESWLPIYNDFIQNGLPIAAKKPTA